MPEETVLSGVIAFFQKIGVYDVVLPFLLVFTITFAILEKTKIFGMEKVKTAEGKYEEFTRKNLNAMASFVIGFLVIASSKLVETITQVSSQIVVLLLLSVFFLLLVGTFFEKGEDVALKGGWKTTFMVIMFLGIVLVFLNAIKTPDGLSWLAVLVDFISQFFTSTGVAAIILLIVIVLFVYWITKKPKESQREQTGQTQRGGG